VLDGVMEMEGRMLVITTNYPEKLDKALIRPGIGKISLYFCKHTVLISCQLFKLQINQYLCPSVRVLTIVPDPDYIPFVSFFGVYGDPDPDPGGESCLPTLNFSYFCL
jgi:hypothetical protein